MIDLRKAMSFLKPQIMYSALAIITCAALVVIAIQLTAMRNFNDQQEALKQAQAKAAADLVNQEFGPSSGFAPEKKK